MFHNLRIILGTCLALGLVLLTGSVAVAQDRAAFNDRAGSARDSIVAISASGRSSADTARNSPRIINGQFVINEFDQGTWEFAASIQRPAPGGHFCGGVLLAPIVDTRSGPSGPEKYVKTWVRGEENIRMLLTAAHCVTDLNGNLEDLTGYQVFSGMTDLTDIKVRQTIEGDPIVHPSYHADTNAHDIAILFLSEPVGGIPVGATPRSIAMPSILDVGNYKTVTAAHSVLGWGRTENGFLSQFLMSALVPYSDQMDCDERYSALGGGVHSSSFCAGFSSGGFDSCQGDSGGSIVYRPTISASSNILAEPILSGLVSWGRGCGLPGFSGVYADVLQHTQWIEETVLTKAELFE